MAETFAIWKPKGISSFRALGAIKRLYPGERVGHGGTLDPLAEGILVVAVGRAATRTIHEAVASEKEYVASVRLGATSITDDAEGPITEHADVLAVPRATVEAALTNYVGTIMQRPPQYSAVHVAGKRAYERARAGEQLEMQPREVLVKEAVLLDYTWPQATVRYVTGPGVYIRSLVRDLGEQLGTGAYMSDLVRTRVGQFTKEQVRIIEVKEKAG